jgi:uncharacterized membrane protein YcaP (DUF421 family)
MLNFIFNIDWSKVFVPSVSPLELFLRGTLVYLSLFMILRFLPNRQIGAIGITDLLVVILFANAAQNAMSSSYSALTDGLMLVATILAWSYVLNWLSFKYPAVQRLLTPPPLLLVNQGEMLRRNMRRELITEKELRLQLRKQGVEKLKDVKKAYMEADGSISIITFDQALRPQPSKPPVG